MSCWKPENLLLPKPPTLSPRPSTSPLLFDEEDPLSQPEGNIAASSSEPTAGESPASPASNSEDVPLDGKSAKGKAPPQAPQSIASLNLPTSDDAHPYVLIRGKRLEVPEAYPNNAEGWLVNDQQFIFKSWSSSF